MNFNYTFIFLGLLYALNIFDILDFESSFWISVLVLSSRIDFLFGTQNKIISILDKRNNLDD